jgi:hypothetical protein
MISAGSRRWPCSAGWWAAGDKPSLAYYLEALAGVAAQQSQPRRAVCLLSAADAVLETNGSGWLHACVPRAPHDDTVLTALRARITEAAFRRAWAQGRSVAAAEDGSAVRCALDSRHESGAERR